MNDALDNALLAAHAAGDQEALITLYSQAAQIAETAQSAAFFFTQAYVFALEKGDPRADAIHKKLVDGGFDTPLPPAPQSLR
ncbi:MAG: hypothetical protein ABJL67_21705 [Sulfitobacter sp.]